MNRNLQRYFGIFSLAFLLSFKGFGQCNTNTSICTPGVAGPFNFVSSGPPVSTCLDWLAISNTAYIILHITSSGPLNMLIDGNNNFGYLDVSVFDIPAGQSPCAAIQNSANEIGCNYASAYSGCNQFGNAFPCASSVTAPFVTAGQELMIVVENWEGDNSSFTLSLGPPPGAQTGPPNPAITPVGPFCVTSGSVQLVAADMGGTWTGPGVSSSGLFNPASAGLGTHTINYSVGAAPCNASSSTTITVNSATVGVSPNVTICPGASTVLTANGATTYSWSPGTGLSATSGATVTADPLVTTTYTVTGTTAGCTSTATVTVTVGGNPTVNPVADQTYCAGATVPSSVFSGGPAGTVYDWTNSNTAIGAPASGADTWPTFAATNGGAAAITSTITVTPSIGSCVGTPITFDITVNPQPTITAGNNGPLCEGADINLTASNVPGGNYTWSGPNGYNNNTQNPTITNSVAGDFVTYTVTVTAAGCSSSATTTVVMNPGVQPTITAVGPYCANNAAVNLVASVAGGTWSGTGITNAATGLFDPSAASIGNNVITYTPSNGCTNPATTTIVVNAIPTIQFAGDVLTGCAPLDVVLTDQSSPVSSAVTWTFGDGSPNSNQLGSVAHTFTSPGCYDITLSTTSNGCSNTATVANYICVLPKADASFYINDPTQTISDPTFDCINTSINATSYTWEFGDGTGSTLIHPSHTYPALPGNYTIVLYANNAGGCIDSAKINVSIKDELIFHIPNAFTPDGDEFNNTFKPVFYSGFDPYSYSLTMYDRWGEILFESHDVEFGWDGTYNGELAKEGIYTWTIKFKDVDNDKKHVRSGHVSLIK